MRGDEETGRGGRAAVPASAPAARTSESSRDGGGWLAQSLDVRLQALSRQAPGLQLHLPELATVEQLTSIMAELEDLLTPRDGGGVIGVALAKAQEVHAQTVSIQTGGRPVVTEVP